MTLDEGEREDSPPRQPRKLRGRAGCFQWTADRVEELHQRWADGQSAFLIGEALGCSRNAVIGKVHRLGLTQRQTTIAKIPVVGHRWNSARWERKRRRSPRAHVFITEADETAKTVPVAIPPKIEPPSQNLSLLELTKGVCKWPYGDHAPFLFCGNATLSHEVSWCPHHARRVVSRPAPMSDARLELMRRERRKAFQAKVVETV